MLNAKLQMLNVEKIVNILLVNRGIKTEREREEFFHPLNPLEISVNQLGISQKELDKAVRRIEKAIAEREKVIVYGDYDVDGVCATTILWETLHFAGAKVLPYIPSRFTEGYGLSKAGIENLKLQIENCSLIITVDNGIVANEGVDFAKQNGIDVIITDHHERGETKPDALAVVHTTKISGSGVAWIFARELAKKLKLEIGNWKLVQDHLGLAALGTIADALPLIGYNRAIAIHGLKLLRQTNRPGIKALCLEAGIKQEELDTFHIGFGLAPRLNAMGRVDHAMQSLRLLCTRNATKARELATTLGKSNRLRQEKTESVVAHVQENHDVAWSNGNLPKLLFVHHESYEEGVIGIAAGRLVEKYHRPAIVISQGEEFSKASARSITGVNIIDLIRRAGDGLLKNVGGHPMAAGFTVATDKLELLAGRIFDLSVAEIKDEVLVKNVRVDCELGFIDITQDLIDQLKLFAPFGYGNPEPTFESNNVYCEDCRLIGKDQTHIKMILSQQSSDPEPQYPTFDAIGFRMSEWFPRLTRDMPLKVIYSLEENDWNGNKKLQFKLRNIAVSI